MPNNAPATVVRGIAVEKVYASVTGEVRALRSVDLSVEPAEITAIVGPSGSGKSTLLRIVGCLDRATGGRVELDGVDVGALSSRARRRLRRASIGYVFQSPDRNLLPYLSATEHLQLAAKLRPAGGTDHDIGTLLEVLALQDRRRARPAELSGGEQQRLALAMAVVGQPRIVIADEPTAELDSDAAGHVVALMRRLRDDGATIVVASHDPVVVNAADRSIRLAHGALQR